MEPEVTGAQDAELKQDDAAVAEPNADRDPWKVEVIDERFQQLGASTKSNNSQSCH